MKRNGFDRDFMFRATICIALLFVTGCAEIRLNSLPAPSPTAKLRVFVLPVSGALSRGTWGMPHAEFASNQYRVTAGRLSETGIYTVVSPEEVQKVAGGQEIGWQWESNEWELAKKTGRALHADYVLILMRGRSESYDLKHSGFFYVKMVMINLATGKQYEKFDHVLNMSDRGMQGAEHARVFRECYQEIFRQAKGDMLATAIRKGRLASQASELPAQGIARKGPEERPATVRMKPEQPKAVAADPVPQKPVSPAREAARKGPEERPAGPARVQPEQTKPAEAEKASQRAAVARESGEQRAVRPAVTEAKQTAGPGEARKASPKERMIVYDLQTTAQLNVVGLILSEALREELFALGGFDLINREDMDRAIQEMKLQQSGLIDDKQALQIGKWMAANQTITGNLGIIGDALILQTKRTDLQTMVILSRGSARAGVGKEEELLEALPALVRKLTTR